MAVVCRKYAIITERGQEGVGGVGGGLATREKARFFHV